MLPIIIGGGLLALIVLGVGIVSMRSQRQQDIEERLGRYTSEYGSMLAEFENSEGVDYEEQQSLITRRLDAALADTGFAQKWRVQLARADLKLTVAEYAALHGISMAGSFLIATALFNPITGGVLGILGFFFPRFYVARQQTTRLQRFEGQLPDTRNVVGECVAIWVFCHAVDGSYCQRIA
jgi:Flp pilus assembly protein TadB